MSPTQEVVILLAEDDAGHARLVERTLVRAGLRNAIQRFSHGQAVLDFLFCRGASPHRSARASYLLLLDIRMPQVDGVEVLRQIKQDPQLRKLPVIVLTTTDDPREVGRCHEIGCAGYIVKPVSYEKFTEAVKGLGLYLSLVQVPPLGDEP
jgi:CheY-like chemotaxis protein